MDERTASPVTISPFAGKQAPKAMLVDVTRLERENYGQKPDIGDPNQRVIFGTSGHRGSPLTGTFTEAHVAAITQAICDYRRRQGIDGPLYMGKDTHALSEPAQRTALEVLVANGVDTVIQRDLGVAPTPVISHAILVHNHGRTRYLADGVVVTPSHNPPEDSGFKYNTPRGIRSTEESRRAYRELLFTASDAATSISGVIMQDETIRQKSSTRTPLPQVLASRGVVPGIKVDTGAKPLALAPAETITEGLDGLRDRLVEYRGMGARFAKWRAVSTSPTGGRVAPA